MTRKKPHDKLDQLTHAISDSLGGPDSGPAESYEYSASYTVPLSRQLYGSWEIFEHTLSGEPWIEVFKRNTFKDMDARDMEYAAVYEFHEHSCIKRVLVSGLLQGLTYHYRMNMVLDWSVSGKFLRVKPLIGYQYSCVDGKPAAVQDLPPGTEALQIEIYFEEGNLILLDGNDSKKLRKLNK